MGKSSSGKIRVTRDYRLFEMHEFNRDLRKLNALRESMAIHGWIDAYPMHVVRNGKKKLKIKAGHHRFVVAQELGIAVKFVVCADKASIFELERSTNTWNIQDYLTGYVRMNSPEYITIKEYHERTGIGLQACISMMAGQCAGSNNHGNRFKDGTYSLGDTTHAGVVGDIIMHMKKCGVSFAATHLLVQAVSKAVMVEDFDVSLFKHKVSTFPSLITKKQNLGQYLLLIEEVYNYKSGKSRLPVMFLATEAAKARRETFGRIMAKKQKQNTKKR